MKGTFECAKVHCQSTVGALQGNAPNSWGRGGGGGVGVGGFGLPRSQVNAFPMSKSVMIGFGIVLYIFILL